jgi:hypothetical protein
MDIDAMNAPVRDDKYKQLRIGPLLTVTIAVVLLGTRFFLVISKYSVNVFYWDQWDVLSLFFRQQASFTNLFFWQNGPHRHGLGLLPMKVLYPLTRWNTRVDCFVIGAAIFAAMLLALQLKRRLYGSFSYSDVAIPAIFLTMALQETILLVPNPAPMAFPLLLTILYCLALLARNRLLRYSLVLLVNYFMINTGYAIFMSVVTVGFFILECYWSWRRLTPVPIYQPVGALLLAIASQALFFIHYVFQPAADCFHLPHNNWLNYLRFMGLMVAGFVVPRPLLTLSVGITVLGATILVLMVAVFVWHSFHLLRSPISETHLIGAVLLGFSLLFATNAAVGRLCLGIEQALSSRYSTLLIPAFLAIYFFLLSKLWYGARNIVLALWVILLLPAALTIARREIRYYSDGKRHWANCYVRTGDINHCDESTNFKIYPTPEATHLQQKLDYLKANHLNLFAGPPR